MGDSISRFSCAFCVCVSWLIPCSVRAESPEGPAAIQVQQALEAEVQGDLTGRRKLLASALSSFPENPALRWQSGYVRVGDEWLSVDQAERRFAQAGRVAQYRQFRDRYAQTLSGQVQLARWCRREQMADREKLHWTIVLNQDPRHREARARLAVQEYRGRLLTKEQVDQYKQWQDEDEQAMDHWKPRFSKWKKELDGSDERARDRALAQLKAVNDPAAIPALEEVFSDSDDHLGLEAVRLVGRIPGQAATASLVRHAVLASSPQVRTAAAEALRDRSVHEYVPALLGSFQAPAELNYYVSACRQSSEYWVQVKFDRLDAEVVLDRSQIVSSPRRSQRSPRMSFFSNVKRASFYQRKVAQLANQVHASNQQTRMWNKRIAAALTVATNEDLGEDPEKWLKWWQSENYLYSGEKRRVYSSQIYRLTISCFLRGTEVSTDSGLLPIEQIRAGDRVLAQNPETGELAYKLVLDTTIRPASPTVRIRCGGEEIVATFGHPIWVVGKGWEIAKDVEPGELLHSVDGGVVVDAVEPGPKAEAYNLVVADFPTYFVGKQRVLVHDNRPRMANHAMLPGWKRLGQ